MRYLGEDAGAVHGELYEDLDGSLYEWVEGYEKVDGVNEWGEAVGCATCVGDASPDLGALYATPDGAVYQMHGLGAEDAEEAPAAEESAAAEAQPSAGDAPASAMGRGRAGQIRVGPGGHRFRWVHGKNAQGKPIGFWRRIRPMARPDGRPMQHRGAPNRRPGADGRRGAGKGGGFLRKLMPIAKLATRLIPVPGAGAVARAGLNIASKLMKPKGVSGHDGLGALYAAPDGTVYQMHGVEDDGFNGFAADERVEGFAEIADGAELAEVDGFAAEQELALASVEPPASFSEPPVIQSIGEQDLNGIDAYVRQEPPRTRWFKEPTEPPALWKPHW
jgi:hypothetical protein